MFGGKLQIGGSVSWIVPGVLSVDAIETVKRPRIEDTWPNTKFLEQYDQAVDLFGPQSVRPPLVHGILESALELCGQDFLEDLLNEPRRAEYLLDVLTESIIAIKEYWDRKVFGQVSKGLSLGGCSTVLLSPELVRQYLVPRYSRIANHFGDAFLCSCGLSTNNLANFAAIEGIRYVRVGWGTDLALAAELLANRHIKVSLSVVRAASESPDQIEADVLQALEAMGPVDKVSLLLIHAGTNTPDVNVRRIAETAFAFAQRNGIELKDTPSCSIHDRRDSKK